MICLVKHYNDSLAMQKRETLKWALKVCIRSGCFLFIEGSDLPCVSGCLGWGSVASKIISASAT